MNDRTAPGPRLLEALELPGTTRILVHAISSVDLPSYRARKGPLLHGFAERALLMARPGDVVCVAQPVERGFLEQLSRLGVGVAEDRIVVPRQGPMPDRDLPDRLADDPAALSRIRSLLPRDGAVALEPFLATRRELRLARALERTLDRPVSLAGGNPDAVARADQKHWIRELALALGIPVAPGEVVDVGDATAPSAGARAHLEAAVRRWARPTGAAILRASRGAGGSGTLVVGRHAGAAGAAELAPGLAADAVSRALAAGDNRFLLVESLLPFRVSPNLLVHLPEVGPARCVAASDQRLDEALTHRGNAFPSRARTLAVMVEHAERLGERLLEEGCRGVVGIDFLEALDEGERAPRPVLVEVNPRVNGAFYPTALLETLARRARDRGDPVPAAFASAGLEVPPRSYADLVRRVGPVLLEPGAGCGALPYHTGGLRHGKLTAVAVAERLEEAEALLGSLHRLADG